jgi:RNA polymerase subunit RPABC4/transcription elongation factor Spt4
MAVCSSCGSQISDAMNFCTVCGQPAPKAAPAPAPVSSIKTCQSCGATADPSSAFCTICGGRLPATAAATDTTPLTPQPPDISASIPATAAPVDTMPPADPAEPMQPASPASESSESSYPTQAAYPQPQQPSGGKFGLVILILLAVIAGAGFGAWYFWGVETVVVCSPPDVRVYLDDKEITPTSYGRYVIPHVSRKPHLLKVQSRGFADTIQRLDFPLTSSQEWVNIRLVPSRRR